MSDASVDYLGKRAVKVTEDGEVANGEAYAIVRDAVFHNGAMDVPANVNDED